MSQHAKILSLLENGEWICSSQFYAEFIADPRTRICELKKLGYELENRKCQKHNFHTGGSKEWRLIGKPDVLNAPQAEQKQANDTMSLKAVIIGDCCWHRMKFGYCEHEKITLNKLF